ncbi:DUF2846 domain-containing protein [Mannheimia indoligenes]|uniref:DUF2846 domain-containing protein n=1 Tax=Mannheimia indoligenes TaxID=3103145 RepID=UPI002FE6B2B4
MKKLFSKTALFCVAVLLTACSASVPMANQAESDKAKAFNVPDKSNAGLYIYRDSFLGKALKKSIYIDGKLIGESAPDVFFYKKVGTGEHIISTESEFGNNDLKFTAEGGKNYFVRQYIRMGVLGGQAALEMKSEEEGKQAVSKLNMAITQ